MEKKNREERKIMVTREKALKERRVRKNTKKTVEVTVMDKQRISLRKNFYTKFL